MSPQSIPSKYGCHLNKIDADKLFNRYESTGFLYEEKRIRLAPFWEEIRNNWNKALTQGDALLRVMTYEGDETEKAWASISGWRHTFTGWNSQHLVSVGKPYASRAVMLAEQMSAIDEGDGHQSFQNWFQSSKRMPNRVFGSIGKSINKSDYFLNTYDYLILPIKQFKPKSLGNYNVEICSADQVQDVIDFISKIRGPAFCAAEEINRENYELAEVNDLYEKADLFRYRKILTARSSKDGRLVAVLMAYRGPLGLNFSFLENRCEIVSDPNINEVERQSAISSLLARVIPIYSDFSPESLFIVCKKIDTDAIANCGASLERSYTQSIWTRQGYRGWYRHIDNLYARVAQSARTRRALREKYA